MSRRIHHSTFLAMTGISSRSLISCWPSWSRFASWVAFSRRALHLVFRASVTIPRSVKTVLSPWCFGITYGAYLHLKPEFPPAGVGRASHSIELGTSLRTRSFLVPPGQGPFSLAPLGHGVCQLALGGPAI